MGNILVENTTFGIRKTWMFSLLNISVTLGKLLSVSESQSTHLHNGNYCSITLESRYGSYKTMYLRSLHRAGVMVVTAMTMIMIVMMMGLSLGTSSHPFSNLRISHAEIWPK